jgi:hypothetical protein
MGGPTSPGGLRNTPTPLIEHDEDDEKMLRLYKNEAEWSEPPKKNVVRTGAYLVTE